MSRCLSYSLFFVFFVLCLLRGVKATVEHIPTLKHHKVTKSSLFQLLFYLEKFFSINIYE